MKKKLLLGLVGTLALGGIARIEAATTPSSSERPNFIFILTDDQRYDDLSFTGNKLGETPNIDQLASDGMTFDNAFVTSAICTPSRASILTGQYERKHNINFNSGTSMAMDAWAETYPVKLREAGYFTGYIGKNHVPVGENGYKSNVLEESFDYWYGGHKHLKFYPKKFHPIFKKAKADTQVEILTEGVLDFLDSNEFRVEGAIKFMEKRPKNKPFALSLCFNLPHGSSVFTMKMLDSDPEIYRSLYRDKEVPLPDNYVSKKDIKKHKIPLDVWHLVDRQEIYDYVDTPKTLKENLIRRAQAMFGIDLLVGKIRKKLEAEGIADNTVLVFTSDHGIMNGEHGLGGKALCYEECIKVPFIIYHPKEKKSHGKRVDSLVQTIDVAATMLSYAGVTVPDGMHGKDLSPILKGYKTDVRDVVYTENIWSNHFGNPRCESVRTKDWKYIRYHKNENPSAKAISDEVKSAKFDTWQERNKVFIDRMYSVHDYFIPQYRKFIDGPVNGEEAVFEELFHISFDGKEEKNLAYDERYSTKLKEMRKICQEKTVIARGHGTPKVLPYTKQTQDKYKAKPVIKKHD